MPEFIARALQATLRDETVGRRPAVSSRSAPEPQERVTPAAQPQASAPSGSVSSRGRAR